MKNDKKVSDEIAERLADAIEMLPYSVSEIAIRLDVKPYNIYRYISKLRVTPLDFCRDFCDVYDIDYNWLLTGFGKPKEIDGFDSLSEEEKTALLAMVANNRPIVVSYLQGETDYKEPYIIKNYRHAKNISRKAMQRLLIRSCEEIRKG